MITFDEAFRIVMDSSFLTGSESVPFNESAGRILSEDIRSDSDMPPFNRAAVDGFACRKSDLGHELEIVEVIPAGREPVVFVGNNQCSKIMTGAIVPEHCDIVFMVEDSGELPSGRIRFTGENVKSNISYKGEDVKSGEVVLKRNKFIKPQDIAVMASVGHVDVMVSKKPRVGIISTGDELVEPFKKPALSQIRNSNSYQLLAQVMRAGGHGAYYGIAPDTGDSIFDIIVKSIEENDIVLLTGGVSMGDFDYVPLFLKKAGVRILFDKVNVQPGKPTTFGVHSDALVFGLPGNPVSSFIQFETLVRPLMNRMSGYEWRPLVQNLPMGTRYERKSTSRMGWIPVYINEQSEVFPVEYHGSAHISALPYADGIVGMQPGLKLLEKGEIVNVRHI